MASSAAESAVRNYLTALKDPKALRDDEHIASLNKKLKDSEDQIERVKLQQQLQEATSPSTDNYEETFVTHAKAWADDHGISAAAFVAEGVPSAVLRRAGFPVRGGGRRGGRPRKQTSSPRSRVTAEEVRSALPKGSFTIKQVQEATGASVGVVRKVLNEEIEAKRLKEAGPDPDHQGPGRAPTLYKR